MQTTALTTRMIELPAVVPVAQKTPDITPPQKPPPKPIRAIKAITKPKPTPAKPAIALTTEPEVRPLPAETAAASTVAPVASTQAAQPPPVPVDTPPAAPEVASTPAESLLTPPAASSADTVPPAPTFTALSSGQHTYKVAFTKSGNSNQGKADILWQQDGEKYALNLTASFLFTDVFTWKSTGLLSPTGLLPERFSDKRYRKSEVAAHFDRTLERITFSANTPDAALLPGAQDRISVIWQIAGFLGANPSRYPPSSTIILQTVSATDAEPWLFTVNEPETLNLETSSQVALRLTRNPRREFDQKIELWFAPAMNYLPVRFRFTETNGDYVDAVWQSVQTMPKAMVR